MNFQNTSSHPIRTALLSVSDKTGIVALAKQLTALDIRLLSTGGTARLLKEAGLSVTEVADYTGFPEIMGGRVKTLHPKIHGGILSRRGTDEAIMEEQGIDAIDLVVVNLYPFEKVIHQPQCSYNEAIENIDIGGPCLIRAAAKNHAHVTVVVAPQDYDALVNTLKNNNSQVDITQRQQLAQKAFQHTAHYDGMINQYLLEKSSEDTRFPEILSLQWQKKSDLRYGENPHQSSAFYCDPTAKDPSVASAHSLQGKALSYNNIADSDAALECVKQFSTPACVIVKHANPCGVATGENQLNAYQRAYKTDPTSSFGGIIAFNESLQVSTAQAILEQQFVEVIIAPGITEEALAVIRQKPNIRVLSCEPWPERPASYLDYKRVNGGLLVQEVDHYPLTPNLLSVVTKQTPTSQQQEDALFAWQVAQYVKSNAIVYAKNNATVGIGAGQMSRIDSAKLAHRKAQEAQLALEGCVLASDAFFPFRDVVDYAHSLNISTIIQPGGSIRDKEVIAAADEHGIAMLFTGVRHFRH
ncbi:MAG: bifunctional phosphoribosylaminoimidazolecarboxamide formyltransferase/IMP cyclohydrolase [Gammaproteobacteria bacterium]